jgi:tetratricopeptide (TPR) repeat protein
MRNRFIFIVMRIYINLPNEHFLFLPTLLFFLLMVGCEGLDKLQKSDNINLVAEHSINPDYPDLSIENVIELIDEYGGDPYDPDLPEDILGATDIVLSSSNPRELANIITLGIDLAKKEVKTQPRLLFELGRIAIELEYYEKGIEWITEAEGEGSIGALAYLGLLDFYEGRLQKCKERLLKAQDLEYDGPWVIEYIYKLSNEYEVVYNEFNRSDLIKALATENIAYLQQQNLIAKYYIGTIQNVLWETDILFLVENTDFVLELNPQVSVNLGFLSKQAKNNGIDKIVKYVQIAFSSDDQSDKNLKKMALITEQATQDARRLALLYNENPELFIKIYKSIVKFSESML